MQASQAFKLALKRLEKGPALGMDTESASLLSEVQHKNGGLMTVEQLLHEAHICSLQDVHLRIYKHDNVSSYYEHHDEHASKSLA